MSVAPCFFDIAAENDPTAFARILDLISIRNHLPRLACARLGDDDVLSIAIEVDTLDEDECSYLGKKFESIPSVISVHSQRSALNLSSETRCLMESVFRNTLK